MVHEYAKRNSFMHIELFNLIESRDWSAIGQRCEHDIEKLRELSIDSDEDSKTAIENWVQIIEDYRDRWVRRMDDNSVWEDRSIIQASIAAGFGDRASLIKLAMLPEDATTKERKKATDTQKKENTTKAAQRIKMQRQADAALLAENNYFKQP